MRQHFITLLLLVLAITCYVIGAAGPATALLVLGVLAEAAFWIRIYRAGKKS